jgi:hypothetical protein
MRLTKEQKDWVEAYLKKNKIVKLGRQGSSKSIVVYSDIHDGSFTSVCSPEPVIGESGGAYKPNKLQKILYNAWVDSIDSLTQKPKLLVINGEPMDGANPRQLGQQSWTTDINDQMEDSAKLIKLIPYDNLMFVRGSGYHVQSGATNYEEVLAQRIGATGYKAYGGSGLTDYYAFVDINGKMFNFTHHVGFNKWAAYRTTAISRELVHVEFPHTHGVSTPAWKFPDAHLFRGGVAGTTPDVGCVEFIIEPNEDVIVKKHIAELEIKPLVRHF